MRKQLSTMFASICDVSARLVTDERGSATVWNLMWLTGFGIMAGLAIDTTDARRVQVQLVSTADVAALAGVMEIPAPAFGLDYNYNGYVDDVEAEAKQWALANLSESDHGAYFSENEDVYVGHWDQATRMFTWGGAEGKPINAVRVYMGRSEENGNGLGTTLLRFAGLNSWDIGATATAIMDIPDCYRNGIISANSLKVNSGAAVYPGVCLHAEVQADIQNNNEWWTNTAVSTGWDGRAQIGPNQYDENGAPTEVNRIHAHRMPSAMVWDVVNVGRALLDLNDNFADVYNPDYAHMRVAEMQDPSLPVIVMDEFTLGDTVPPAETNQTWLDGGTEFASLAGLVNASASSSTGGSTCKGKEGSNLRLADMIDEFDSTACPGANLAEYRTYYAPCSNKLIIDGTIRNVVIVSECKVSIRSGSALENAMLVVLDEGKSPAKDKKALSVGSDVRFGAIDTCAPGGGVRVWVGGDFSSASGTTWYGAQIYVANDFDMAGQSGAAQGISAHVGNDVHISAGTKLAAIQDDVTYIETEEGGVCAGNVDLDWITSDYQQVLVD